MNIMSNFWIDSWSLEEKSIFTPISTSFYIIRFYYLAYNIDVHTQVTVYTVIVFC